MGYTKTAVAVLLIGFALVVPFAMHAVGLFTPNWGSNSTCEAIGLLSSRCLGKDNRTYQETDGGDGLSAATGFHLLSFVIMLLTVVGQTGGSLPVICPDDDSNGSCASICSCVGGCCFMLYPSAGLFSLIGCIIVATTFSTSELGYSFALCLTSGCYIILASSVLSLLLRKDTTGAQKSEDDKQKKDDDHKSFKVYMRRINITTTIAQRF